MCKEAIGLPAVALFVVRASFQRQKGRYGILKQEWKTKKGRCEL